MSQQEQTFLSQQFQVALRAYFPGIAFTYPGNTRLVRASLELEPEYQKALVPVYRYLCLADAGICRRVDPAMAGMMPVPERIELEFNTADGMTTVRTGLPREVPLFLCCMDCLMHFLKQLSFAWVYRGVAG